MDEKEILRTLAYAYWERFEYSTPQAPYDFAVSTLDILTTNGYKIVKADETLTR